MFISYLFEFSFGYLKSSLIYRISKIFVNSQFLDPSDLEPIEEKLVEIKVSRKPKSFIQSLFLFNKQHIPVTTILCILTCIAYKLEYVGGIILILVSAAGLIASPFVLSSVLLLWGRILLNEMTSFDNIIKNEYFKFIKRREQVSFGFKSRKMAVKGMRVSVLESLRHVTNELINTSRHHLLPNENKVLMIDLVNDNMLELCNGQEFGESVLDMTSLQAMSQFLVLTQSEFLKFLLLDVFENVEKEEDNWVIFGIAYKLVKLIMHVKKVYEYERKGLKEKYEMICASELIIKEKKREFKVWHGESNVVVVKDIVGLFLEQLNQTEDSLIIGNEQLIDISKSLVKLLESKVTKSTQIEDLDDVSSCESDDYECSDREGDNGQHMPKYEVFEGQSTKDEDKVEQSTALYQEMSNDHKIQMTNLMNELKAPLQVQRKYHEEAEISAIAVRKGISIEEVKKARQTQIEEDKKREVKKQDLETMYPSPAEMDAQLNLIKEMRENMFLKQKRRTNETVFGDSSDSDY